MSLPWRDGPAPCAKLLNACAELYKLQATSATLPVLKDDTEVHNGQGEQVPSEQPASARYVQPQARDNPVLHGVDLFRNQRKVAQQHGLSEARRSQLLALVHHNAHFDTMQGERETRKSNPNLRQKPSLREISIA